MKRFIIGFSLAIIIVAGLYLFFPEAEETEIKIVHDKGTITSKTILESEDNNDDVFNQDKDPDLEYQKNYETESGHTFTVSTKYWGIGDRWVQSIDYDILGKETTTPRSIPWLGCKMDAEVDYGIKQQGLRGNVRFYLKEILYLGVYAQLVKRWNGVQWEIENDLGVMAGVSIRLF